MSFAEWADVPNADVLARIVVVSPHFDDAASGVNQSVSLRLSDARSDSAPFEWQRPSTREGL